MRTFGAWCIGLVLIASPLRAAEPEGKLLREYWDAAYLEGVRAGYAHTSIREIERDGQKFLRTSLELDLTVKRYKETMHLRMITATEETPEGKVTAVGLVQPLDKGKQLVLRGVVEGNQLHVKVEDPPIDKKIPWNDEVIGLARQDTLLKDHHAKPGDRIKYLNYEPSINSVVTIWANVKDLEDVEVLRVNDKGRIVASRERLLRVEGVPEKVVVPGASVQLPTLITWVDKDLNHVLFQTELPGIGKVVMHRTTKEVATGAIETVRLPDIGLKAMVPLNRYVERPLDTRSIIYRITVKDDDDPKSAFAEDARQSVRNLKGNTFDLVVKAVREPKAVRDPGPPPAECLESCYYLDSDNEMVKKRAREAVGSEKDPWRKAQLIERWVYEHVDKKNYSVTFATSSQVAQNLEGDCRQHAVLAAGMCRAAGVPSRTAIGLVYGTDDQRRPALIFHMWTEVWIQGQWLAIDGTLGRGSIGASHIKITDSSWHDMQSLKPLLPVTRILGKVAIEIISVNELD